MSSENGPVVEMPLANLRRVLGSISGGSCPSRGRYGRVIIGGMGGSGIVGSVAADLFSSVSPIPVVLLRVQSLPTWAGEDTLVIVVSYSGNTSEMISLYADAMKRGCGVVVITSGGELERQARADGAEIVLTDGGFMPRSDISTPVSHVIAIIDSMIGTDVRSEYMAALAKGAVYAEGLEAGMENEARRIAMDLSARTPFFYASEQIGCIASRWRAQFNENAKVVAADSVFPEFDHNELEGWCSDRRNEFLPVILRSSVDGETRRYMDACCEVLTRRGSKPYVIDIAGETLMETIVFGIILGDYVSIYLAQYLGVDPSPVEAITEFKGLLKG